MLALADIKTAINNLLKQNFDYKVYGREVKEGFDKPSFFVEILHNGANYETKNITSHSITVIISYFQNELSDLDNIKTFEKIKQAFLPKLYVKNRGLTIKDIRMAYADTDILQISFDLEYFDEVITADEQYDIVETINIKLSKE